jgi:YidC/Oxa1 family membrane protein insertase
MEQRNIVIAFVLSMLILLGWGAMFPNSKPADQAPEVASQSDQNRKSTTDKQAAMPELRPSEVDVAPVEHANVAASSSEVAHHAFMLQNDRLNLKIDDRGWLVDATLLNYTESIEPGAAKVEVLHPGTDHSMYINSGVLGQSKSAPFREVSRSSAKGAHTAVFEAPLSSGKIWQRTVTLHDGSYVIDISDRIKGGAGLNMFQQVVQRSPDKKAKTFYEHNGPVGFINDKLQEIDYDDLDDSGAVRFSATGGWTAMMDRYFIAALIGDKGSSYRYYYKGDGRSYQSGVLKDGKVEGSDAVFHSTIYVGPKSIPVLASLHADLERSVDFGWFAFIAKPMHSFLLWLFDYVGNFGWCIILLVLMIKILFFYPTHKAYSSMASMRKLQPEMMRMKDLYGDDRQRMGQEMMKLYKKHKVNPMGGCLPIIIQIPVFFALYKVLLMSIEMRQAPFIGWIHDLSVQDPYFVLPVLMGASMFIQQRLNPQPTDPMQAKILQFLPPLFTVMFLFFPSGLVLYWFVNNVLSIAQQWYVMKVKQAI